MLSLISLALRTLSQTWTSAIFPAKDLPISNSGSQFSTVWGNPVTSRAVPTCKPFLARVKVVFSLVPSEAINPA